MGSVNERLRRSSVYVAFAFALACMLMLLGGGVLPQGVSKAFAADASVSIVSEATPGATSIDVQVVANDKMAEYGATLYVYAYPKDHNFNPVNIDMGSDSTSECIARRFNSGSSGTYTLELTKPLEEGMYISAYTRTYDWDIDREYYYTFDAVEVKASSTTDPVDPTQYTRQDIIAGSWVAIEPVHPDGVTGDEFTTDDTGAKVRVKLHPAVESARLSIVAYPKSVAFDYDSYGINTTISQAVVVRDGDELEIPFTDAYKNLDNPTAKRVMAYLFFADPTDDDAWPIVREGASINIVDASGQTTEGYTWPEANIVESELPVGATALHINLTGDERLFQTAKDTQSEGIDSFWIKVLVVEYDADIRADDFDFEETPYVRLYDEVAFAPFENKEITLSEPLIEGKRVRALVFWNQYRGDKAVLPIVSGRDYDPGMADDSVLVTKDAAPIVLSPAATITSKLATDTTSFDVQLKNLPENAILMVKAYSADEEIKTQNGRWIASGFDLSDGTRSVEVPADSPLKAGERVVAFVMVAGEVKAQSEPAIVASDAADAAISIEGDQIDRKARQVSVNVASSVPAGAKINLREYNSLSDLSWSAGRRVGSLDTPVQGQNTVTLDENMRRSYLVAFLASDYGNDIYAVSTPVEIVYNPTPPRVSISSPDVMFTVGDKFVSYTYSVDTDASDVSYKIYQFDGDTLDPSSDEVIGSGTLVVHSHSASGGSDASLRGELKGGAKVQMVLTADGLEAYSNVLTVGDFPSWAEKTPSISFGQAFAREGDSEISVVVDYDDGYKELGPDEFYCNIAVYQIPGYFAEREFNEEDIEDYATIAGLVDTNGTGPRTNGTLTFTLDPERVILQKGMCLVAKLRMPDAIRQDKNAMWHDYLSVTIPVIGADDPAPEGSLETPEITEGADQTYTIGSGAEVTIVSSAPYSAFDKVLVDGAELDASCYTAASGSTRVTLANSYLDTLTAGDHSVAIVSSESKTHAAGSPSAGLKVMAANTGDTGGNTGESSDTGGDSGTGGSSDTGDNSGQDANNTGDNSGQDGNNTDDNSDKDDSSASSSNTAGSQATSSDDASKSASGNKASQEYKSAAQVSAGKHTTAATGDAVPTHVILILALIALSGAVGARRLYTKVTDHLL